MAVEFHRNDTREERIARYIIDRNFTLKRCNRYVKNAKRGCNFFKEDDCVCGHSVKWHINHHCFKKHSGSSKVEDWSQDKDTIPYQCDTFGELIFHAGYGIDQSQIVPGAKASFIRIERRTQNAEQHMDSIYTLMTDRYLWAIEPPQLLIEVTGSAKPLPHVDQRTIQRFNRGLISAAKSANAWIVTGGTNCGVMRLVGDAVTKARMIDSEKIIPCIGIVSWGVVNKREMLVASDDTYYHSYDTQQSMHSPNLTNGNTTRSSSNYLTVESANTNKKRRRSTSETSQSSYDSEVVGRWPADYVVEKRMERNEEPHLDPGHTAFLFVDNGRDKRFGEEIEFRAQFLHFLSKKSITKTADSGVNVPTTPLVLLVVGGGPNTLKTIKLSTADVDDKSGNQTSRERWPRPVVVLPGFGGAADILAFAYSITEPSENHDAKLYSTATVVDENGKGSEFPVGFDERIKRHPTFKSLISKNRPKNEKNVTAEDQIIQDIRDCLQQRNLITVVELFEDDDDKVTLDQAILNAIFKARLHSDPAATFQLAQLWQRCDTAKDIFKCHPHEINKNIDFNKAMTRAIEMGETDFFEFFIEYGLVDLKSYLTLGRIRSFYEDLFIKRCGKAAQLSCISLFRCLLMNGANEETLSDLNNPKFMENVGAVIASLLGCYIDNMFNGAKSRRRYIEVYSGEHDRQTPDPDRRNSFDSLSNEHYSRPYDTNERDLMLFLLILHRQDMAITVWKNGHDHLGSALMAAIFTKSLAKEASRLDMMDLHSSFDKHATKWQDRAISLLNYCYNAEPHRCNRLLSRSLLMWQGLTLLEMAYYGKKKRIMEHPAIQTKLAQIWLGRMATFTKPSLIYLTMMPPLLPFSIFRIRFEEPPVFARSIVDSHSVSALAAASPPGPASLSIPMQTYSHSARRRQLIWQAQDLEANTDKANLFSVNNIDPCCTRSCFGRVAPDVRAFSSEDSSSSKNNYDKKLLRPTIWNSRNQPDKIFVSTAVYFFYSSPTVKFVTHSLALIVFLLLFSSFVLAGPEPNRVGIAEIVIWSSCFIYFADLVRDTFGKDNLTLTEKTLDFCSDTWNMVDASALIILLAAIIQRFALPPHLFIYPRSTYAIACVVYWVKSLHIFYVTKTLGPKVATLFKMLHDLAFFLFIYIVLLLAFSMPIHSLLRPGANIDSIADFLGLLLDIAYNRIWNLFTISMDDSRQFVEGTCQTQQTFLDDYLWQGHQNGDVANGSYNNATEHFTAIWDDYSSLISNTSNSSLMDQETFLNMSQSWLHGSVGNFTLTAHNSTKMVENYVANITAGLESMANDSNVNATTRLFRRSIFQAPSSRNVTWSKLWAIVQGIQYADYCSTRNVIAIILYVLFLLFTNIVLLSLLIAMFSYSVGESTVLAESVWRYNIYRFAREYYYKPVLPGPFMAFELFVRLCKMLMCKTRNHNNSPFKEYFYNTDDFEYRKLEMFERSGVEVMAIEKYGSVPGSDNVVVRNLRNVHEKLHEKLENAEQMLLEFRNEVLRSDKLVKQ